MKNFVYKFTFEQRLKNKTPPYYYIGSKSNSKFINGFIIDKNGKKYFGSSNSKLMKESLLIEIPKTEILKEFVNFEECLKYERIMHIEHSVVKNPEYFNLSIANDKSTYTNPEYCTVRHKDYPDKFIRLRKDDPDILNGIFINANKGFKTYNNGIEERQFLNHPGENWKLGRLKSNILKGEKNPFYGKSHTEETKNKIKATQKENELLNPEKTKEKLKKLSETCKKTFSGIPKSEEHKKKIGRKGMIMLQNKNTLETIRIKKEDKINYDSSIWVSPISLRPNNSLGTKWCNNGIINKKIKSNEDLPLGFNFGKLKKVKNEN
jgi:hypothetical protein